MCLFSPSASVVLRAAHHLGREKHGAFSGSSCTFLPCRELSSSSNPALTSRPVQVPQASSKQLRGSGANPPGAPPDVEPSPGNPRPEQAVPVLLPRRRHNLDSSRAPKRAAAAGSLPGLQKAQSVHSLVPQGEEQGGPSSRVWGLTGLLSGHMLGKSNYQGWSFTPGMPPSLRDLRVSV